MASQRLGCMVFPTPGAIVLPLVFFFFLGAPTSRERADRVRGSLLVRLLQG
ncbi:hypothetical protein MGG_16306 [Pyricularia oryzae 70-15]|uniref:Uncharacterized protein n=1 Tax=Pyricularia oryzae (strain 70-15 / ATCC MYA-4617 / FGSC 8958) TaxID=242507 RepID=G4MS15_PYRO7|nr:uncharacterized protein MGG_16306 [Pyricularia oryzae 70-15]EHA57481.1 hypothetical protein MGG_16306 [Pyricularia oryzae 70-15]KAI7918732.1 hypothetical protein M9X92_006723 [Pyricularia oryzae]KAI7919429.1 hypothetical protein M0657_007110 [Pyricularia oryzae]